MFFQKKELEELGILRDEVATQNDKAKETIKSPEILGKLFKPNLEFITLEECSGTLHSKHLNEKFTAYSIIRVDVRNAKDSHILSYHQKSIDELESKITSFEKNASRSVFEVEYLSDKIFASLAKIDHVIYKNNMYALLFGEENSFKSSSHHECRLGQWYEQGIGKIEFAATSAYKKLENPRAIVHEKANKLAKECGSDKAVCSKEEIESMVREIEAASEDIFSSLDEMVEEKAKKTMLRAKEHLFDCKGEMK